MENSMKNNDEIEIDLRQIFIVIMSKIAIILLVGVIFGLAAFIGSKLLLKPVYQSQTSLYVLNKQSQGTTTLSDLQSSTQLTQDYMILDFTGNRNDRVGSDFDGLDGSAGNALLEVFAHGGEVDENDPAELILCIVRDADEHGAVGLRFGPEVFGVVGTVFGIGEAHNAISFGLSDVAIRSQLRGEHGWRRGRFRPAWGGRS